MWIAVLAAAAVLIGNGLMCYSCCVVAGRVDEACRRQEPPVDNPKAQ